jgi:AcrR family transcriptional regulator
MSTEQRVRRAALELFAARGFHGTGIRDLAEAAGLRSATLYHYMGTKEDLLVAIMRTSLERLIKAGTAVVAGERRPAEQIARLVGLHVLTHAEQPLETRVVDDEMRALSPERRAEIVALRDEYEALWQSAINAGCHDGSLRTSSPPVARLALLEMCGGISRWYSPDGPLSLDDLAARYIEMALGMLGADRPAPSFPTALVRKVIADVWGGSPVDVAEARRVH